MTTADLDRFGVMHRLAHGVAASAIVRFVDGLADRVADLLGVLRVHGLADRIADLLGVRRVNRLAYGIADLLGVRRVHGLAHRIAAVTIPRFFDILDAVDDLVAPNRLVHCLVTGVGLLFVDDLTARLHDGMAYLSTTDVAGTTAG